MPARSRLLIVAATRSDILHVAPLMRSLEERDRYALAFDVRLLVTRQEDTELDQALGAFGLRPDDDLGVKTPRLADAAMGAKLVELMEQSLRRHLPSAVLVVGYSASAWATAVACYFKGIPMIHLGAGGVMPGLDAPVRPFPEWEHARELAGQAVLHLALDEAGKSVLENRILPEAEVAVVGHGPDALLKQALEEKGVEEDPALDGVGPDRERVLVFLRRREHHANASRPLCMALNGLARSYEKIFFFCPFSLQSHICDALDSLLEPCENLRACAPLPFEAFIREVKRSRLVITDSSGVAREGLLLGRPILALGNAVMSPGLEALAEKTNGDIEVVDMDEEAIREATARRLAEAAPETKGPVVELDTNNGEQTLAAIVNWWQTGVGA